MDAQSIDGSSPSGCMQDPLHNWQKVDSKLWGAACGGALWFQPVGAHPILPRPEAASSAGLREFTNVGKLMRAKPTRAPVRIRGHRESDEASSDSTS